MKISGIPLWTHDKMGAPAADMNMGTETIRTSIYPWLCLEQNGYRYP